MTTTVIETTPAAANGAEVFIPLNKLKKHPKNARKTPHSEASIEAKAASIHAKGILQNLVVEPEFDVSGEPTGFYLVAIGEGRRLAQLLRVKRKQIKKTDPIRCVVDTENDPAEISLDENVTRENLHPADEYERFRELSETRGWGAEEIAARFGVTAHVVRQRMRLYSTGLSSRSWTGSPPRFRRRAGNGRVSISTIPTPTASAGTIRSRWSFRRRTRPHAKPRRRNMMP